MMKSITKDRREANTLATTVWIQPMRETSQMWPKEASDDDLGIKVRKERERYGSSLDEEKKFLEEDHDVGLMNIPKALDQMEVHAIQVMGFVLINNLDDSVDLTVREVKDKEQGFEGEMELKATSKE